MNPIVLVYMLVFVLGALVMHFLHASQGLSDEEKDLLYTLLRKDIIERKVLFMRRLEDDAMGHTAKDFDILRTSLECIKSDERLLERLDTTDSIV